MRTPCGWARRMGVWAVLLLLWLGLAEGMREHQIKQLRQETEQMFYHGFDNYRAHAFPEDELRPLTCGPLTRNQTTDSALTDVLGNYSLTLIDSLSTLAILSSSPENGEKSLSHFQNGVRDFVKLYGDGSDGPAGQGERSRGFDLDSKVQLFETVIRGLGGLLSAHLFAVGDLPITTYDPPEHEVAFANAWDKTSFSKSDHGITWSNGLIYDGQLLRLAVDLANRLLPAFYTETGLPYPRVNLRHGVPFYTNSPLNTNSPKSKKESEDEATETCSAGAGSLVLEMTVLSRLTGDGRYEDLAKRAFWAVWVRRSVIGLIGFGIDAESGKWMSPYSGIGAGTDSFFEYAFKSHVLLSAGEHQPFDSSNPWVAMDDYYAPLKEQQHSAEAFLDVWEESQESINRHLYRGEGYQYPHFILGDVLTGATRGFWIDSLSAYYPGLLTLAGKVDEAIEVHLLATAIWTRYSGLPERWNVATGDIEGGLGWYGGRPEFIESTYYIYRATQDPWYLHVGEMVLRDIKRRCWTKCGWAGILDVLTGELINRMESFFLGETAKYLFLLFDPGHPLNHIDAPWVFSTEGHPLVIPKRTMASRQPRSQQEQPDWKVTDVCPVSPPLALGISSTASRSDLFHAAHLARLDLMPTRGLAEGPILEDSPDHPSVSVSDLSSPSNYTFYPWTLPPQLVPFNATSAPMTLRPTLDISFPSLPGSVNLGPGALERVQDGVFVKTIGGLRLSMVQDGPYDTNRHGNEDAYRVQVVNNVPLGKDEKVYLSREITFDVVDPSDPNFTRVRDTSMLDLVIDVLPEPARRRNGSNAPRPQQSKAERPESGEAQFGRRKPAPSIVDAGPDSAMKTMLSSLVNSMSSFFQDEPSADTVRLSLPASMATGVGAAPMPDVEDATTVSITRLPSLSRLSWSTIYFADELCHERLLREAAQTHEVLVIKRGDCTFSEKLRNIAAFRPSRSALKLVIVVSYDEGPTSHSMDDATLAAVRAEPFLVRPHLEESQITAGGIPRPHPISLIMLGGGDETYELLRHATGIGIRRRYMIHSQGVPVNNVYIL
ncbi:hypothetical protein N7510_010260 [Penicillium lagena]|uniref:uncharacterized protein n=1 Tax=Penicillium lagena TaxID=94218 RepID=UPI002540BC28|nr:uncharacterized protein N7510_010260 [Penicillium lagena]KAJ5605106.1 hypothetical protein N7510_010260 [Penicillium lagena]